MQVKSCEEGEFIRIHFRVFLNWNRNVRDNVSDHDVPVFRFGQAISAAAHNT